MTPSAPDRILGIGLRQIGDLLLDTPAIRHLRRTFPSARIDVVVDPRAGRVLENNPDIDRLLPIPPDREWRRVWEFFRRLRRERYDWAIDFLGNPRSAWIARISGASLRLGRTHHGKRWAYNRTIAEPPRARYSAAIKLELLEALGLNVDGASLDLVLAESEADRAWAAQALPKDPRPLIAVAPASKAEYKTWPAGFFAETCALVLDRFDVGIVLVVGPGEEPVAAQVADGCSRLGAPLPVGTLHQTGALFRRCALYFGNDSGLRHLAVAAGLPTVTIFGRIQPEDWTPPDPDRHRVIRRAETCLFYCLKRRCPEPTACLSWVKPAEAAETIASVLIRQGVVPIERG